MKLGRAPAAQRILAHLVIPAASFPVVETLPSTDAPRQPLRDATRDAQSIDSHGVTLYRWR
jgi:hypothetical protein